VLLGDVLDVGDVELVTHAVGNVRVGHVGQVELALPWQVLAIEAEYGGILGEHRLHVSVKHTDPDLLASVQHADLCPSARWPQPHPGPPRALLWLRTMCGSRTGEWSLPRVMSD
jgi:hypothetical protein